MSVEKPYTWPGGGRRRPIAWSDEPVIFGAYPVGFERHILRQQLLGAVGADDVLHVCSGGVVAKWTVDVRAEVKPRIVASAAALPFAGGTFRAVLIDPPYNEAYARQLYRVSGVPTLKAMLDEAVRVVVAGGRVGILHFVVPMRPDGARRVLVRGISTGPGFQIRALTVFEKAHAQQSMLDSECEQSTGDGSSHAE
jgi:hypothetical protein